MQSEENHRWKGCFEGERTIFTKQTADCGNKQKLVSGYGQFHSNESTAKNPQSYAQVTLEDIRCLVDNPQQVDKTQAQWLIPSTLQSRIFKKQEENGEYLLLWVDIDKNLPDFDKLVEITNLILDSHDFEAYTSRSATEQNQKA
ncbi:MAG: hypothetical protein H0V39_07485, partial [Nitrosomonas sp.]|nr:hypothetical protein [Nitrosomonas sp.]